MSKDYYEIKKDCPHKDIVISSIDKRLKDIVKAASEDVKITIEKLSKRSNTALAAYWCLNKAVVEWDKDNNGLNKDIWHEWFKREVGLVEDIDLRRIWEIKFKDLIKKGGEFVDNSSDSTEYTFITKEYDPMRAGNDDTFIYLGDRYINKTRSLSNKGDITKIEMERLLNCVLKFGADNQIPGCEIKSGLDELLKFSEGWKDE